MGKYVSRSIVMANGERLQNIKSFREQGVKHAEVVKTMDGEGTVDVAAGVMFEIDYAVPKVNARRDWTGVVDETWTRSYVDSDIKTIYIGVKLVEEGEERSDAEGETVRTYTFHASERISE